MLERHRSNAACASCHARMDPLGFALENFDALGRWRTMDGETPIDATGVLLDGTKVDGPASLRAALVQRKEQFIKAVTAKLLMYGLGREIEYYDAPAIRGIMRAAAADNYRWSSTILAIVKSTPFQMRRASSAPRAADASLRRSLSQPTPTGLVWQPTPSREAAMAQQAGVGPRRH
jgi:hypothetical protein